MVIHTSSQSMSSAELTNDTREPTEAAETQIDHDIGAAATLHGHRHGRQEEAQEVITAVALGNA